jgi:hypothetical protein
MAAYSAVCKKIRRDPLSPVREQLPISDGFTPQSAPANDTPQMPDSGTFGAESST